MAGMVVSRDGAVERVPIARRHTAVEGVVVHVWIVSPQRRWALRRLVNTERRRAFLHRTKCPHISEAISQADQTAAPFRAGFIAPHTAKVPEP